MNFQEKSKKNEIDEQFNDKQCKWGILRESKTQIVCQGNVLDQDMWKDLLEKQKEKKGDTYHFNVIMMDPNWTETAFKFEYKTMKEKFWMNSIPLKELQLYGYLFIWITNKKLESCLAYMEKNNYQRVEIITWIKIDTNGNLQNGIGFYLAHFSELCVVGIKENELGNKGIRDMSTLHTAPNVILEERDSITSKKPNKIYQIIEMLVENGNYLEIFARNHNQRKNWVSVGDQAINATEDTIDKVKKHNAYK